MSTEDYKAFYRYLKELGNNTKIQQQRLTKEHLIKEGWKYDEIDNSLELITENYYILRINGTFLTVEGSTWYYGGKLPNLEQWEVLKQLLNLD